MVLRVIVQFGNRHATGLRKALYALLEILSEQKESALRIIMLGPGDSDNVVIPSKPPPSSSLPGRLLNPNTS